jgi:hypothetical protein
MQNIDDRTGGTRPISKQKALENQGLSFKNVGSAGRTRTADPVINSHLLYQLSYCGPNYS